VHAECSHAQLRTDTVSRPYNLTHLQTEREQTPLRKLLLCQLHPLWQPPAASSTRLVRAHARTHTSVFPRHHRHRSRAAQRLVRIWRLAFHWLGLLWLASGDRQILHLHHVLAIKERRVLVQLRVCPGKVNDALRGQSSLVQCLFVVCQDLLGWRCIYYAREESIRIRSLPTIPQPVFSTHRGNDLHRSNFSPWPTQALATHFRRSPTVS